MATVKVQTNTAVHVKPGEEVTLEIPGASTTGHLWTLRSEPGTVEVRDHQIVPDGVNFGGGGVERFTVKPLQETSVLHFDLRAPWETEPAETLSVEVQSGGE